MNNTYTQAGMRAQLSFIFRYAKRYGLLLSAFPFLIAVDILFDIGIAKMQGFFIDMAHTGTTAKLLAAVQWVAILMAVSIGLIVIHRYLIRKLRGLVQRDIAADLFRTVNEMPYEKARQYHSGDLVTRIKEDTEYGADIVDASIEFVTVTVIIAASFVYLLTIDLSLALFALLGAPLLLVVGRLFDRRIQRLSADIQVLESDIRGMTQEMLQGMSIVQIYGIGDQLMSGIAAKRKLLIQCRKRLDTTRSLSHHLTEGVFNLLHIGALLLISLAAIKGTMTPGTIATFSLLFELVIWPIIGLSEQWNRLYEGGGAFQRIHELMTLKQEKTKEDNGAMRVTAAVEMSGVSYRPSPDSEFIIRNLNFTLQHGEVVAVVGASGSGKSTFVELCSGLLGQTEGSIRINRSVAGPDRQDILYLTQNPYLFTGSVRENIRLSCMEATDDSIVSAAQKAWIHDEIVQLEHQYETEIGERGGLLSGGQKQRVSLSRLYTAEPDFIVMDEPTSALDESTEQSVMLEMKQWLVHKTAVIVTHRLELASHLAKRIVVMDQGRIAEEGTHEELLLQNGLYRKMHNVSNGMEQVNENALFNAGFVKFYC
ncbi:ABC transporter ATP-binding protein [Paenibacillus gorillae]|uniref:ABC transporter ATP-binding protein n=1 Tax=Paenibacillus gorillae TaxID=1243662 RepID=UPI0004B84334|nr:ABC transporter ATP-binding protein [Paenibacillus gorillae]